MWRILTKMATCSDVAFAQSERTSTLKDNFITARKRNIFAPFCHSVHGGGGVPGQLPPGQVHPPGRHIPLGRYTPWVGTPPWQVHPPGQVHPRPGTPPRQVHPPVRYTPLLECILILNVFSLRVFLRSSLPRIDLRKSSIIKLYYHTA